MPNHLPTPICYASEISLTELVIAVIGRVVRGDLSRLFGLQIIQVERSARLIHDGGLVARPARVGKPDLLGFHFLTNTQTAR